MLNNDFWHSIKQIIDNDFDAKGLSKLEFYADNSSATGWFMNDFHRSNSMAAQREVQRMSLQPYSREQKLMQIASLRQSTVSKESSNAQRNILKE